MERVLLTDRLLAGDTIKPKIEDQLQAWRDVGILGRDGDGVIPTGDPQIDRTRIEAVAKMRDKQIKNALFNQAIIAAATLAVIDAGLTQRTPEQIEVLFGHVEEGRRLLID